MADDDAENTDKYGQKETENPSIMDVKRSCRDIFCLLLFLVCWLAWLIVAIMAFTDGCPDNCNDPSKLVYGFDSNGCMCGKDCSADDTKNNVDNTGKKRLYIPDPREASMRLCVADCPPEFAFDKDASILRGTYSCTTTDCKDSTGPTFALQRSRGDTLSNNGKLDNCFVPGSKEGDCWYPAYPTSDVFFKCVPSLPAELTEEDMARMESLGLPVGNAAFGDALAVMSNPAGEFGKLTGEVQSTWPLLLASVIIAVVLGFVFLMLIRMFALPMMWIIVIGLVLVLGFATLLAWDKTGKVDIFGRLSAETGANITALADAAGGNALEGSTEPALVEAAAWILTVISIVYVVLLIFFLKRITIAVKVIVEAAKAMAAMPTIILQPIWTFLSLLILYLWAAFITIYLVSAGEFDPATGTFTYAGGTCKADLAGAELSVVHSAALVSVMLPAGMLLRGTDVGMEISFDNASTWSAAPADGMLQLTDWRMKGSKCTLDAVLQIEKCEHFNTSSSPSMVVGGCFGDSNACDAAHFSSMFQSTLTEPNTAGEIQWSAPEGALRFYIKPSTTVMDRFSFVANIHACNTTAPAGCGAFSLANTVSLGGIRYNDVIFTVETTDFTSSFTVSDGEALRSCNLYGTKETAIEKLIRGREVQLERQGKADVRELGETSWASASVTEWKGMLPVTLDGETYNYFVLFHLFMFLWTNNFTVSSGYYIVCGAVAAWYWELDKKELPKGMVWKSTVRYVRYNLGTVAFGSFIIAVVQMIRILFNYFVNKSKQFKENPVVKALVCIVNCCLWCLEKVIGYINKNAYIMSATHGMGFCKAAFKGFMLLLRNLMRVAAVNVVAGAILFFGKVMILLSTLIVCYLIATSMADSLSLQDGPPFLSLVIIAIMTWYVASSFMNTYAAAVDTIFLSFLHDQEVNDGSTAKPYYMADSLRASIGVKNADNKVTPE